MNNLAATTANPKAIGQVFNTAVGERADLNKLIHLLKENLSKYNSKIADIEISYGPERKGDIPHSLASIEKAATLLNYAPSHKLAEGLKEAMEWYWENLK
jgi:UDP-N-acetylglucosamine 4-epimerase